MKRPERPDNEAARLQALRDLDVLDSRPEERFDQLTRIAKRVFRVPIVLVSLVDDDRQWFKSRQGLDASETARDISFCGHAILGDDTFIVEDAHKDPRFADNPLVLNDPNISFYAGTPLKSPDGYRIGTLCLIDRVPRSLGPDEIATLEEIATLVNSELAVTDLGTVDKITGLANRRGFYHLAEQGLALSVRERRSAVLCLFQLNRYSDVCREYGDESGRVLLRFFTNELQSFLRESDLSARIGVERFAVLLFNTDIDEVKGTLSRFEERCYRHSQQLDPPLAAHFTFSVADFDGKKPKSISHLVDQALTNLDN